jgi:hypothetical protein
MNKTMIVTALVIGSALSLPAFARGSSSGYSSKSFTSDHTVSGYAKSNGTYVTPYHATNPNSTKTDNYSTRGNVNPYTGAPGTKSPYNGG